MQSHSGGSNYNLGRRSRNQTYKLYGKIVVFFLEWIRGEGRVTWRGG